MKYGTSKCLAVLAERGGVRGAEAPAVVTPRQLVFSRRGAVTHARFSERLAGVGRIRLELATQPGDVDAQLVGLDLVGRPHTSCGNCLPVTSRPRWRASTLRGCHSVGVDGPAVLPRDPHMMTGRTLISLRARPRLFGTEWIGERPSLRCVPVEDLSGDLTGMRASNGCVRPRTRAYRHDSARVGCAWWRSAVNGRSQRGRPGRLELASSVIGCRGSISAGAQAREPPPGSNPRPGVAISVGGAVEGPDSTAMYPATVAAATANEVQFVMSCPCAWPGGRHRRP